jgi:sulfide:quinone oxidoreductase
VIAWPGPRIAIGDAVADFRVVIVGAGIAGVEGLLRLRRLAGEAVTVTLLSPAQHLVYRPSRVLEPFAHGQPPTRYPVERIAADANTRWVRDSLSWLDRAARIVHTTGGQELPYDALLLALGGQERKPNSDVVVFTDHTTEHLYREIMKNIESGVMTSLALVEPSGPSWPLPLYELALLTAKQARDADAHPQIAVVTPDPRPLDAFGGDVSDAVTRLLTEAGITLYTGSHARARGPRRLRLEPSGIELEPDRIVTLPTIEGPNVRGLTGGADDRFIEVDEYCRVRDTDGRIFAAGDATDLRVKQGGLAAQQADTAAAGIAHLAGTAPPPARLRAAMQGALLTGRKPLYLTAYLIAGSGVRSEILDQPPWGSTQAIVAEELTAYLATVQPTLSVEGQ